MLLAMPRVRVLAPWRDSGEIAHRSGTIDGICANTDSYVHVRCEEGPQQCSATSLRCTEVIETTQNKD